MAEIDEHLAYYRDFCAQILEDLGGYKSGARETFDITDTGRTNTTPATIADLERRLAFMEKIIAAYEERKNASRS